MQSFTGIGKIIIDVQDKTSIYGVPGGGGGDTPVPPNNCQNMKEIIDLDGTQGVIKVELTIARIAKFGAALCIQVELEDDQGIRRITSVPVKVYIGVNSTWVYEMDFTGQDAVGRIVIS